MDQNCCPWIIFSVLSPTVTWQTTEIWSQWRSMMLWCFMKLTLSTIQQICQEEEILISIMFITQWSLLLDQCCWRLMKRNREFLVHISTSPSTTDMMQWWGTECLVTLSRLETILLTPGCWRTSLSSLVEITNTWLTNHTTMAPAQLSLCPTVKLLIKGNEK